MMLSRATSNAALMVAVLTYLLLASASAARKAPWEDEGFINSVAHNLRVAGRMSSPMLEPGGLGYIVLPEVDKYTYYHMPVYFLLQAALGHFVTLSPLGIRSLSILAGLLGLLAWAVTFRTLLDPIKALVAILMLSIDYLFVLNASTARQDMLSAAFAAIGYASYLSLRARTLAKALLVAHGFIATAALTHPLGGLVALPGLLYLIATFDGSRIRLRHAALSALPYVVGGTFWLLYIFKAPSVFLAQFSANLTVDNRAVGLVKPWLGLAGETTRYGTLAGLSSPHILARFRGLTLLAFALSVVINLASRRLRLEKGHVSLLVLITLSTLALALFDGRREPLYLVHTIPFLVALTAATTCALWRTQLAPHGLIATALLAYVLINAGGTVYLVHRNDYARIYKPAADFLRQHGGQANTGLIFAPSEIGLALEFPPNLRTDVLLGFRTGKIADWIVVSSSQRSYLNGLRTKDPEASTYVAELLATRYRQVYRNRDYDIYQLISPG